MPSSEDSRTPGLLEQADRARRGLPLILAKDLLAQADAGKRDGAGPPKKDLTTQAQRAKLPPEDIWLIDLDEPFIGPKTLRAIHGPVEQPQETVFVLRARRMGWNLNGTKATPRTKDATMQGLAVAITGDERDYKFLDYDGDPKKLWPWAIIDIGPLLVRAREIEEEKEKKRAGERQKPTAMKLSEKAIGFMKDYEGLRLKPYCDQTAGTISHWQPGATIGIGHFFGKDEWEKFKNGISKEEAEKLLLSDMKKAEDIVRNLVKVPLLQQQYDAMVILAFNIGVGEDGFAGSTVLMMVNDPGYTAPAYKDLESAWKAWKKSQGKVNQGLINRRRDEWEMYSKGDYRRDY